ncbi:NfeD family protein [Methylibium sp.]|uniref:NfeD family protein n=1 Tax=Methylibium sp. TaxID=2067992 RepID=UPI003D0E611D
MDWSAATWWWIASGALIAAELTTGTFYLLMLALGLGAAALAAHAGLGFSAQLLAAALVGGGAVIAWHLRRLRQPPATPAGANRDVNLDIGERVHVSEWQTDGSATVHYRGAQWSVRYAGDGAPAPGEHVIHAIDGSRLLLVR